MDLSMILSAPVADDDPHERTQTRDPQDPPAYPQNHTIDSPPTASPSSAYAPPFRPARRWNADEVECAVSILHDFQAPQPVAETGAAAAASYADEPQREPPLSGIADGHAEAEARDAYQTREQDEAKPPPASLWGATDAMSKLDLLVQADAAIQTIQTGRWPSKGPGSRPKPKAQAQTAAGLRSGVWTRAEEEYAAALMYYFLRGELGPEAVREGTTLRKFLADELGCNRRRVSMKLATEAIAGRKVPRKVGASVFVAARPQARTDLGPGPGPGPDSYSDSADHEAAAADEEAAAMRATLAELRRRCFRGRPDGLLARPQGPPGSDHYPPYHGEPLEQILDRPPQCVDADAVGDAVGDAVTDGNEAADLIPSADSPSPSPPTKPRARSRGRSRSRTRGSGPTIIRTGFASQEEDEYVSSMVEFFLDGALALPAGTPLVGYLCGQLRCTPRALSLKLAPSRHGERRRFPDDMASITFAPRFRSGSPSVSASVSASASASETRTEASQTSIWEELAGVDGDVADEVFEVESRLRELQLACLEAQDRPLDRSPRHPDRVTPRPVTLTSPQAPRSSPKPVAGRGSHPPSRPAAHGPSPASRARSFSRSGAWSREEEAFTAALIDRFFKGTLEIAEGTTLRAFLAATLRCNPMRVSKKLASECIADVKIPKKLGSSTFVRQRHADEAGGAAVSSAQAQTGLGPGPGPVHYDREHGDAALRELERAFQLVDSAKHMAVAALQSPSARGRRRKLPLSPLDLDSDDERTASPSPQPPLPRDRYATPSSEEEDGDDGRAGGKARRTDYSRSPAAEAARQRRREEMDLEVKAEGRVEGVTAEDGGAAAFEARIVPLARREQFV